MICKDCGKQNDETNNYCIYCNSPLVNSEDSRKLRDIQKYETDLGFADPDSKYINSQIIYSEANFIHINNRKNQFPVGKSNKVLLHKKRIKNRQMLAIFVILVNMILQMFGHYNRNRISEYDYLSQNAIEVYYSYLTQTAYAFNSKGEILNRVKNGESQYYSPDHTAVLLSGTDDSYYVNAKDLIAINHKIQEFAISEDGKFILYTTGYQQGADYLYRYDIESGEEKLIDQIKDKMYFALNISPDGKIITYSTSLMALLTPMEYEAFMITNGGEPKPVGKDLIILAVSNNAKYTYYIDFRDGASAQLYVRQYGVPVRLSKDFQVNNILFNKDNSEIMFSEGGYTYVSVKGSEKHQVADAPINYIITPKKCIVQDKRSLASVSYGIDSFKNKVALFNDGTLRMFGDKYQSVTISPTNDYQYEKYVCVSGEGNELLYETTDSKIMKVIDLKGKRSQITYIEHISSIVASDDLSIVYYIDNDHLYYMDEKGKQKELTEDVSNLCLNASGDTAFFLKGYRDGTGTLYYSSKGGTVKPISGGDSVIEVKEWNNGIVYKKEVNGKHNSYYNTQGIEFTLLEDGINITQ